MLKIKQIEILVLRYIIRTAANSSVLKDNNIVSLTLIECKYQYIKYKNN